MLEVGDMTGFLEPGVDLLPGPLQQGLCRFSAPGQSSHPSWIKVRLLWFLVPTSSHSVGWRYFLTGTHKVQAMLGTHPSTESSAYLGAPKNTDSTV